MNVSTTLYIDGARIEPTADGRGVMFDAGGDSLVVMLGMDDETVFDTANDLVALLVRLRSEASARRREAVPA